MIPLPEWAPNIHPLITHFPIALLFVAVFFDIVGLFLKRWLGVRTMATTLFTLGAVAALAAFFTGKSAGDQVMLPTAAQSLLTDHADWALRTVWFYGVFALIRLVMQWFEHKDHSWTRGWIHYLAVIFGAGGLFLVVQTGDHGAQMVFKHGIGVLAVSNEEHDVESEHDHGMEMSKPLTIAQDGSWEWIVDLDARSLIASSARFYKGSLDQLNMMPQDSMLTLNLQGEPVMFVLGNSVESLEAGALLQIDQFNGSVQIVHHVQDTQHYDFLSLEDGVMRQGRTQPQSNEIFDEKRVDYSGWITMRVVSDGRHFRGYLNNEMYVHGHGNPPENGPVGLRLEGKGTVLLKNMYAESIR